MGRLRAIVAVVVGVAVVGFVAVGAAAPPRQAGTLRLTVTLTDATGAPVPIPRHAVLVSDSPPSAPPRRVVTAVDGTATLRLAPGTYVVESEEAVAFAGRAYRWMQVVTIPAGGDVSFRLTAGNARVEALSDSTATSSLSAQDEREIARATLLRQWRESVVALWTPTAHASAFVVDPDGLLVTNQRVVGEASAVEVEMAPEQKVAGRVLVADADRDVALVQVAPGLLASRAALPLGCDEANRPPVADGAQVFTIRSPLHGPTGVLDGAAGVDPAHGVVSSFALDVDGTGGPVFSADGTLVALTSPADPDDEDDDRRSSGSRLVLIDHACRVLPAARAAMEAGRAPAPTPLPIESSTPFPIQALQEMATTRAGNLRSYQAASDAFDLTFITPVLLYGAQDHPDRRLVDFGQWTDYVADVPPVVLVRVTPKLVEGFWTTVARGAAMTQGVNLPAIRHLEARFSHLQAWCGDRAVTPIHPFVVDQRRSPTAAVVEGLYVFAPDAFDPACGTVRLELFSDEHPDRAESLTLDPVLLQQIEGDFEPWRAAALTP